MLRCLFILVFVFFIAILKAQNVPDIANYKLTYNKTKLNKDEKKLTLRLLQHFFRGSGKEYYLSQALINDISAKMEQKKLLQKSNILARQQMDSVYWFGIDLYSTKYSWSLGRARIGFVLDTLNKTAKIVALHDYYDFNKKTKSGRRKLKYELVTRFFYLFEKRKKGQAFDIYFPAKLK